MGITGVGSSYNFVYNTKTGKLSTKDGSKNELRFHVFQGI